MDSSRRPQVLIVDDDPQVREVYMSMLEQDYEVLSATSGEEALELVDDDIAVVLLDRRLTGLAGGDVLRELREQGYNVPVAMVTAVEPDFDILEMGFDDYLLKPVSRGELRSVVETLVLRREYDDVIREYFAHVSKVTSLQSTKSSDVLATNDEYLQFEERLEEIQEQARAALDAAIEAGMFEELMLEMAVDDSIAVGKLAESRASN